MDPYHHHLPEVGQIRCYWALLSGDLRFIYLDPVLAYHLDTQADVLIGKSLLSFVHPDEQDSAKTDLSGVLGSRTLHGSVTRVRLLRLSKVRRNLGHTGPPPVWSEAEKIVVDEKYMAVDIVINWAADGLVLCFIHASVDLDPQSDNDETNKSHWTNWCGTPYMSMQQIDLLFHRLVTSDVPHSSSPSGTHTRVFQILSNKPGRPLLLSWPPDQSNNGLTGRDFAKLVENAEMGSGPQKGNDAKTSCTRRYRATQLMSPSLGEVESIFIPHGTVIFACHKVESSTRSTATVNPTPMHNQISYNSNNGPSYPPPPGPYYDPPTPSSYPPLTPTYSQGYLTHQTFPPPPPPPPSTSTYSPPRWSQHQNYPSQPPSAQTQWATPSPTHPLSPLSPSSASVPPSSSSMSNPHLRSASYSATGPPSSSSAWHPTPSTYDYYRAPSPGYTAYSTGTGRTPLVGTSILPTPSSLLSATSGAPPPPQPPPTSVPSSIADVVPPPRRRVSPGLVRGGGATAGGDQYHPGGAAAGASTATSTPGGRGSGNRPSGILECSSCGATSSPEWRKGPSGKKELCNACGLRFARSRAKKDGGGSTGHGRKKKSSDPNLNTTTTGALPTPGNGVGSLKVEPSDIKINHHHHPHQTQHHHVVGGTGSSNGIEIKRHRKRDSIGSAGAGGGMTPPLATIAAAGGSPGYASSMLRKGGLGSITTGSAGSDSFAATAGTSPGGSQGHGHAYYAALAAGAGASSSEGSGSTGLGGGDRHRPNGKALTPSPSPSIGSAAATGSTGASTSLSSAASGSLGLHLSGASPSSSSPSLSVPSVGSGHPPPPPPATSTSSASTISQPENAAQDIGFVHYNAPPTQPHHERVIPPLNVHPHSHTHHSHPNSPHPHSLSHSPSGSTSGGSHPHSPLPGFSAAAHHMYSGYATRPSPLSQAGNIVTGPAGGTGPLTPLSSVPPHSATADASGSEDNIGSGNNSGSHNNSGMQLPPLAYMDRLVHGPSGHGHGYHYGSSLGSVKLEYGTPDSESSASNGGQLHHHHQQQQHGGTAATAISNMGKEPLTPLSAESPIGPGGGVARNHHGTRRTILGGGQ